MFHALRKLLVGGFAPESAMDIDEKDLPLYQEGLVLVNDVRAALAAAASAKVEKCCNCHGGKAEERMEVVSSTAPTQEARVAVAPRQQEEEGRRSSGAAAAVAGGGGASTSGGAMLLPSSRPRSAITAADLGMQANRLKKADKESVARAPGGAPFMTQASRPIMMAQKPPAAAAAAAAARSAGDVAAAAARAGGGGSANRQQQQVPRRAPLSAITANQLQAVTLRKVGSGDVHKKQAGDGSRAASSTPPEGGVKKPRPSKAPFGSPELKAVKLRKRAPAAEQSQGGGEEEAGQQAGGGKRPRRGADQITGLNMDLLERALKQRRERVKAASLSPARSSLSITSPEKTGPLASSRRVSTRSAVKSKRGSLRG